MRFAAVFILATIASTANAARLKKLRGNNNNIAATPNNHDQTHQRKLQHSHMNFVESSCNANVASASCTPIDTFLLSQFPLTDEVKIPCGQCLTFNTTTNTLYNFPFGLNVVDKALIPENASFSITTKYLLVQGLLQMDAPLLDTKIPRVDGALVKIILTGTEDVGCDPDIATENEMACGMNMTDSTLFHVTLA